MIKELPTGERPTEKYHWSWNPKRWLAIGIPTFLLATAALFIATRYWVGHPNDTPAFVSGVIGMITLGAILLQILVNRRQWEAMRDGLDKTQILIDQNEKVVHEAHRQTLASEKVLKKTIEHFEMTERPFLGLEGEINARPAIGDIPKRLITTIKNFGRLPAVNIQSRFITGIVNTAEIIGKGCPEPQIGESEDFGFESVSVLPVNSYHEIFSPILTDEEMAEIGSGRKMLFVWITVSYCKTLNQRIPYVFEYYARFSIDPQVYLICQNHNRAT